LVEEKALEKTGLARIRPYDLRHSAATVLLATGEHPKVVAELLGHPKVTLTLDTYSHVVPGLLDQAAERMEAIISEGRVGLSRR
jgi:site-specific recombinase XerD